MLPQKLQKGSYFRRGAETRRIQNVKLHRIGLPIGKDADKRTIRHVPLSKELGQNGHSNTGPGKFGDN